MTFIKSQADAMSRFQPHFVGAHTADGIALHPDSRTVVNTGGVGGVIREALFRKFGVVPGHLKKLRRINPVIVHAHFGTCGPAGLSIAKALSVPLVVTFHGHDATMHDSEARKTRRGRELLSRKDELIAGAAKIIAVSDFIRDRLIDKGYPPDKLIVHRNGIDVQEFSPMSDVRRSRTIVFVGRFVEKKGASYLLEAATRLRGNGCDFDLVMIGDGPLDQELRLSAGSNRLPCTFTGFLPTSEVKKWLARASVVVVPSVTAASGDSEGLPTILLEAQAMGTPVVTTFHSGNPEGVVPGKTAEIVAERDSDALAEKIRIFLESEETVHAYGQAARQFVCESFDMRQQVAGLEQIFETLIAPH